MAPEVQLGVAGLDGAAEAAVVASAAVVARIAAALRLMPAMPARRVSFMMCPPCEL